MFSHQKMDVSRLLFLIATLLVGYECAVLQCLENDFDNFTLLEGEAFTFTILDIYEDVEDNQIMWNKGSLQPKRISTNESQRVHYHNKTLFILKVQPEDTGIYTAKKLVGQCSNHYVGIEVKPKIDESLLYGKISNANSNLKISCPTNIISTCNNNQGSISWEKDFKPLNNSNMNPLWIMNATDKDEGMYTCICTWKHNHNQYRSTGSRRIYRELSIINADPIIISPQSSEVLADKGTQLKLNCSVVCGKNMVNYCATKWEVKRMKGEEKEVDGYSQSVQVANEEATNDTISTAVLSISKVSDRDFRTTFTCIGVSQNKKVSKDITLRQREISSIVVVRYVGLLLSCLLLVMLLKCFAIDIVLLLRPCLVLTKYKKDTRMYDAYVIYQMDCLDKATDNTLSQFTTKILPSVLEGKCGYRLFIHGRDDIPGQGHLELVESCIQQSKRLMVILTPASGPELQDQDPDGPQYSDMRGFDWQIVLHHALVQNEMGVILIQIGETGPGGFTHLPAGLQHLILKSPPMKWRQDSWGAASRHSRFWKKVRYLMPAVPTTKC